MSDFYDHEKQIAITGLGELERSRLVNNVRQMYSAIMNVDDSQQDVLALGFPLMDLIPILEQVGADLYGYVPARTLTAQLSEAREKILAELKKHGAGDVCSIEGEFSDGEADTCNPLDYERITGLAFALSTLPKP